MLVPVYDILNCGPRHRFMANGKLVHNSMNLNAQNLPRVKGAPTDALRNCLQAPPHHKIVVADLSGIELRVNHFLWQVPSSMALFQADPEKADLYKDFASMLYGVARADVTKAQRQIGKIAHLGLGFGAGHKTFVRIAKMMGGVNITEEESKKIVDMWRAAYSQITDGWKRCSKAILAMYAGSEFQIDPWGLCHTVKDGIKTPYGMIRYPDLREEADENGKKSWVYGQGRHKAFIGGPKCVENLVQHLAREVVMDNALKIKKDLGFGTAHRVHDELIYIVPEGIADITLDCVQDIMRTPPTWWKELIVWSEGSTGDTYGAAK